MTLSGAAPPPINRVGFLFDLIAVPVEGLSNIGGLPGPARKQDVQPRPAPPLTERWRRPQFGADRNLPGPIVKLHAMLIPNPQGHYHFLKGIEPYSAGVIADPGFEIVHVTLRDQDVDWRNGFDLIEARLQTEGVERSALCGVELRSPAPFTMPGFISFNDGYCNVLKQWGLYIGDVNPVARTNVAPQYSPPGHRSCTGSPMSFPPTNRCPRPW